MMNTQTVEYQCGEKYLIVSAEPTNNEEKQLARIADALERIAEYCEKDCYMPDQVGKSAGNEYEKNRDRILAKLVSDKPQPSSGHEKVKHASCVGCKGEKKWRARCGKCRDYNYYESMPEPLIDTPPYLPALCYGCAHALPDDIDKIMPCKSCVEGNQYLIPKDK